MKAFTFFEIAVVLLVISLILGVTLSFDAFNKKFFYLRDVAKNLSVALNITSDLSQKIINKNNQFYCGYGIYFPTSTQFEALAFSTSTNLCELVFLNTTTINTFIDNNLRRKTYILSNSDLVTSTIPSLSLNVNLKPGFEIVFSTSTNCSPDYQPPLIFMYFYSYTDLFFIFQQRENWTSINTDKIYVCFKEKGKTLYKIKVNKLGQISFEQ
ncbi:MAG: hypothetical protein C4348_00520 [Patescibacteria group bacterium]